MNESKNMNINIISIDAEQLANPNWSTDIKNLSKKQLNDVIIDTIKNNKEFFEHFTKNYNIKPKGYDEYKKSIDNSDKNEAGTNNLDIKSKNQNTPYEIREEKRNELYSGSIPVSLDILKLQRLLPREFYTVNEKTSRTKVYKGEILNPTENEKIYTNAIINVTFNRASYEMVDKIKSITKVKNNNTKVENLYKGKIDKNAYALREKFYKDGAILKFGEDIIEYVRYKRSSSKAREGSHLFIKKELKEKMSDWSNFGIKFKDGETNVPLAAIKAYEGLTSSGIEKIIKIQQSEILLIDDVEQEVKIKASVTTKNKDGDIIVEDYDNYPIKNIIWDGQSLLDTSLFEYDEKGRQKGMMLLRNSFFKSCGFNTNIQKWFDDAFKGSKPEYIKDMFERDIKLADIKLITTPSSLKFLKFVYKFKGNDKTEKEKNCYEKWLKSISDVFGVCKSEKASPFGEFHQLSYQIVNSLPLSRDDVTAILENDLKHINSMKNDVAYFKSTINFKDPIPADALMLKLLEVNDKMWNTNMVIEYVKDKVDDYIDNLKQGRIKVKDTDYAVLFGNPIEMLQYATFRDIQSNPLIKQQMYCNKYKDGEMLAGFRNPHITMGNVLYVENVYKKDFDDYFNLTENIVISNAYDTDIMERLQGQDYDSDTLLLSADPILVKASEACQNDNFRVPLNRIEEEKKIERTYIAEHEADIDHNTAANKIGEIVNLSQILNSYYWDYTSKNNSGQYDKLLKIIYNKTSILSSLSQIEIDRAKKDYGKVAEEYIKDLRSYKYNGELLLKRSERIFSNEKLSAEEIEEFEDIELKLLLWEHYKDGKILKEIKEELAYHKERKELKELFLLDVKTEADEIRLRENIINIAQRRGNKEEINELRDWLYSSKLKEIRETLFDDMTSYEDAEIESYEKEIKKAEYYINMSKETVNKLKQDKKDIVNSDKRLVQVRPKFFEFCGEGKRYAFEPFNTPMDYLQEVIDVIPRKNRTATIDIAYILPPPNKKNPDNDQLKRIVDICTEVSKYIKALQLNQRMTDEKRYSLTTEKYSTAIEKLKKWNISENTITILLRRAFSKEVGKYDKKSHTEIKRILASCLYQSHPDVFMQVIKRSKSE